MIPNNSCSNWSSGCTRRPSLIPSSFSILAVEISNLCSSTTRPSCGRRLSDWRERTFASGEPLVTCGLTTRPPSTSAKLFLEELGAFCPVTVSFIAYPKDFTDPPHLGHRAVHVEGDVPGGQLP